MRFGSVDLDFARPPECSPEEWRELFARSDANMREAEDRRRAEDQKHDRERVRRQAGISARARAAAIAAEREVAPSYGEDFWAEVDRRNAAAVNAMVPVQREREAALLDTVRDLKSELRDARRDNAELRGLVARLAEEVAAVKERIKQPQPLPVARQWTTGTGAAAGETFAHAGAFWQAVRNTGTEPRDGPDWICVSAPGAAGDDGRSFRVRGTWEPARTYRALDHVVSDGSTFVAKVDNPGPCPSDGWQIVAMRGKRGEKGVGERGPQGEGVGMLRIVAWTIDGYLAIPTFSNAQIGAALDLRPALEAYHAEAGA